METIDRSKMKEGFYHLYSPQEKEPVLVHGYYNDDSKEFGFGFNTHDGQGFLPVKDLTEKTVIVPVKVQESRFNSIEEGAEVEEGKRSVKYFCKENDNTIEYREEDKELYIGNITGVGGWWVIGMNDLTAALAEFINARLNDV